MTEQDVGPIDYLALQFPHAKVTGEGMAILLSLVDRGIIRILDLRVVLRSADGSYSAVALTDLDNDGSSTLRSSMVSSRACWTTTTSLRRPPSSRRVAQSA